MKMDEQSGEVWRRDEIDSPCVQVCVLHPVAKLCMGCYRSSEEIARWSRYSDAERKTLMAELPSRAETVESAKPKRRGRRRES